MFLNSEIYIILISTPVDSRITTFSNSIKIRFTFFISQKIGFLFGSFNDKIYKNKRTW